MQFIVGPLGAALSSCGVPRHALPGLLAAIFYASTSVAISMLNKALLSSYNFSCYFFMLAAQLAMTLTFCVVSRDQFGNPFRVPSFDAGVYRVSLPMATAYLANVCLGLLGLQLVNVPMFFAIRRTAAAFILMFEYFLLGRVAEGPIVRAVGVIVAGALVAGSESLTADLTGYAITAANNVATAAASVLQKQFADSSAKLAASAADKDASATAGGGGGGGGGGSGFGPFGTMYYQALTALPACIFLSLATGEARTLMAYPYLFDVTFWVGFFLASGLGLLLSYSSLLCTTLNSPLATSITGNAKDVVLTVAGAIAFPGFKATPTSIVGLLLSFAGSAIYSLSSLRKAQASASAAAAAAAASSATAGGLPTTMGGSAGGAGGSLGIHLPLGGGGGGAGAGGGASGGPLGLAVPMTPLGSFLPTPGGTLAGSSASSLSASDGATASGGGGASDAFLGKGSASGASSESAGGSTGSGEGVRSRSPHSSAGADGAGGDLESGGAAAGGAASRYRGAR
jgi:solute carrier family 35